MIKTDRYPEVSVCRIKKYEHWPPQPSSTAKGLDNRSDLSPSSLLTMLDHAKRLSSTRD